jgi:pimeloyl-ACP methyl ester carboxylesterase
MSHFDHEGRRIAYTVYGDGPRTCVLVHGLLFTQALHERLAAELARRGHRVVTIDLLGHGASDRPSAMQEYTMGAFARQIVGLLDHLEVDEAVVGGMSLGANATLEVAALAPRRLRGMLIEMPVLDHALVGCAVAFTPAMVALTVGLPVMRAVRAAARLVPRGHSWFGDQLVDLVRQDPRPSGAVLQGLFFARIAPPQAERRTFKAPTLIIGHPADLVHPFSDAAALAEELENSRLVRASSILELRLTPDRLTEEIAAFLDDCWAPVAAPDAADGARSRGRRAARASEVA